MVSILIITCSNIRVNFVSSLYSYSIMQYYNRNKYIKIKWSLCFFHSQIVLLEFIKTMIQSCQINIEHTHVSIVYIYIYVLFIYIYIYKCMFLILSVCHMCIIMHCSKHNVFEVINLFRIKMTSTEQKLSVMISFDEVT